MNRLLPIALLLGLAGCNKLGGRVVNGVATLIGDAPQNDLSSFKLVVTDIELVHGNRAEPLLSEPVEIELIGLDIQRALITLLEIPLGGYGQLRLAIDPTSVQARDRFGVPVNVNVLRSSDAFVLTNDVDVKVSEVTQVAIDILLIESLHESDDGFDFELTIEVAEMAHEVDLSAVLGRVVDVNAAVERFEIEILTSDADQLSRGRIEVDVGDSILFDKEGGLLHTDDFLDELQSGDIVEVHGSLTEEHFLAAAAVEIQSTGVARIAGTVISLDTQGNELGLRIRDVRDGEDVVREKIGNQPDIVVNWDKRTVMVENDDRRDSRSDDEDDGGGRGHGPADANDLAVGEELDIKFREFESEPFAAREIEIADRRPVFEGRLVAVDGLPKSVVMHLEPFAPAVVSGLVESSDTDILVSLTDLRTTYLDLPDEPVIGRRKLQPKLRVAIRGDLSGPPDGPEIQADILKVAPGMLRGELISFDTESDTGTVTISENGDPFGDADLNGSFHLYEDTRFEGDVDSETGFEQLWLGRQQGERVLVTIEGLAAADGSINVFLMRVSREGGH
jgi:hypothetical protein